MSWKIVLYETPTHKPVKDFIESLQKSTKSKIIRQLSTLETFGIEIGMPHSKPIGDGLYELRIRGKQEVRFLYIFAQGDTIYVLHGFIKKVMAIRSKDLAVARVRRRELLRR